MKVNYDGCHSTEKQKQASHTEVLSSLDAGTDCAGWWSLYTYGLRHLICPRRTPVHSGHMSTTAMLKVNFAQTWGGGGVGACLEKISMGSKDIALFLQRASIPVSCKASRSERVRPPGSHDRNRQPTPVRDRDSPSRLALVRHSRRKIECTWDWPPYAYPIGHISSAAHGGACTAAAALPSDHHRCLRPRHSQTRHGVVMHPHSYSSVSGHFQSLPPVATLTPARCPGVRNSAFDVRRPHRTTRMQTRKRQRRPCWKRSRVANRRTSCCAVSQLSIVTWLFRKRAQIHFHIGTVLDADGTPSDHSLMFPSSWAYQSRVVL